MPSRRSDASTDSMICDLVSRVPSPFSRNHVYRSLYPHTLVEMITWSRVQKHPFIHDPIARSVAPCVSGDIGTG